MSGRWETAGASVRGAAHLRSGAVNQDALCLWQEKPESLPLVLAVADGHGGAAYTRSHIGAAIAVRTALRVLAQDLLPRLVTGDERLELLQVKRLCDEWLPRVLVRRWQAVVRRYARRFPVAAADPNGDRPSPGPEDLAQLTPFGATVVAALLTPDFHLYLQLGDGDILTVAEDGTVSRPLLPVDDRLLGNETTSLCSPDAAHSVRLAFQPVMGEPPGLILLSTDGYANSFVDAAAFEQVGADLLAAIRGEGLAAVQSQLTAWLEQTSASGSGDDITVALALCTAADLSG